MRLLKAVPEHVGPKSVFENCLQKSHLLQARKSELERMGPSLRQWSHLRAPLRIGYGQIVLDRRCPCFLEELGSQTQLQSACSTCSDTIVGKGLRNLLHEYPQVHSPLRSSCGQKACSRRHDQIGWSASFLAATF